MNYAKTLAALTLSGSLLASTAAMADLSAKAVTDLNIRKGPGPQFEVVGVIPQGADASVAGCTDQLAWCQVSYNGTSGWSHSSYLSQGGQDEIVVLRETENVPVVKYDGSAAAGAVGGAVIGTLIAGPIGAVVGGAIGAGLTANPPQQVTTYVSGNRSEPVYLEGEVVVGAQIPDTVALQTVPDYEYHYAMINGQTVLVDPGTRQIVYVYR